MIPYGTRFSPTQSNADPAFPVPAYATFHATVDSLGDQLSLWVEAQDDVALKRFIGCMMVVMMPQQGLSEALNSLKDMVEFYSEEQVKALPPVQVRRDSPGRVTDVRKRPDLIIAG